jgi:serine/threonine protein kinase
MEHLEQGKVLETEEVARILKQLLLAVNHMHHSGIAHKDIKLENILMDKEGRVKLIDFGFALYTDDKKISDHIGTPLYKAPELVKKEDHGFPVDIWAIGIATILMMTMESPYNLERGEEYLYE